MVSVILRRWLVWYHELAPRTMSLKDCFPSIPDRIYFLISEVCEWCGEQPHVLRYWESEFSQLRPERKGRRRFYRPGDMKVIRDICHLLRKEKYTVEGAKECLKRARKGQGKIVVSHRTCMRDLMKELQELRNFCERS